MAQEYINLETNFIHKSVADLVTLAALDVTNYRNGDIINVIDNGMFAYLSNAVLVVDGVNIIATPSIGVWVRQSLPILYADTLDSSVVSIKSGGTGQNNRQSAMNALAGSITSGKFLRGNGVNVEMNEIQVEDLPQLPPSSFPTIAISKGGTGQVTRQAAVNALVNNDVTNRKFLRGNGINVQMDYIQTTDLPNLPIPQVVQIAYDASTNIPNLASILPGQVYNVIIAGTVSSSLGTITGALKAGGSYVCIGDMICKNYIGSTTAYTLLRPDIIKNNTILSSNDFSDLEDIVTYLGQRRFNVPVTIQIDSNLNQDSNVIVDHVDGKHLTITCASNNVINFSAGYNLICNNSINFNSVNITANLDGIALVLNGDFMHTNGLNVQNTGFSTSIGIFLNGSLKAIDIDNDSISCTDINMSNSYFSCFDLNIDNELIAGPSQNFGNNSKILINGSLSTTINTNLGISNNFICNGAFNSTSTGGINFGSNCSIFIKTNLDTNRYPLYLGNNNTIFFGGNVLCTGGSSHSVEFTYGNNNRVYFTGSSMSNNFTLSGATAAGNILWLNNASLINLPYGTSNAGVPTQYTWRCY